MWSARDRAARLLDLRAGGGRDRHALHAELALDVPHAEQLDGAVRPAHQPRLLERVGEAALRDAADERHLPALEPGAGLAAGPRGLPLASPAGGLADPRAGPTPLADAGTVRAGGR